MPRKRAQAIASHTKDPELEGCFSGGRELDADVKDDETPRSKLYGEARALAGDE